MITESLAVEVEVAVDELHGIEVDGVEQAV